jgi:hypothetical protein
VRHVPQGDPREALSQNRRTTPRFDTRCCTIVRPGTVTRVFLADNTATNRISQEHARMLAPVAIFGPQIGAVARTEIFFNYFFILDECA